MAWWHRLVFSRFFLLLANTLVTFPTEPYMRIRENTLEDLENHQYHMPCYTKATCSVSTLKPVAQFQSPLGHTLGQ